MIELTFISQSKTFKRAVELATNNSSSTTKFFESIEQFLKASDAHTSKIVLDCDYEQIKAIKSLMTAASGSEIIGIIGHHAEESKSSLEQLNFTKILSKPLDFNYFFSMVQNQSSHEQVQEKSITEPEVRAGATSQILSEDQLQREIQKAVYSYCHEHFRDIAKESIKEELRTLTDLKASKLLDTK